MFQVNVKDMPEVFYWQRLSCIAQLIKERRHIFFHCEMFCLYYLHFFFNDKP